MSDAWLPTRFSAPLSEAPASLFGRYREVFRIAWTQAMGYSLDEWQEWLLDAITELRPDGHLRFRQVIISLGRQNGKTEIAAALGLLFMLAKRAPYVVGIADSAQQARLVYDRTMRVIKGNPSLSARFEALTDTRGIRAKDGGKYEIKASRSAALQGLPIDLGICDEVHLLKQKLWTDLLNGTGGRPDSLIVGITTAGDDDSELLKHLYNLVDSEKAGETFGHFIWEAPETRVPADDEEFADFLRAANPAIATGRRNVRTIIADLRSEPDADVLRYALNRFVGSSAAFVPIDRWAACAGQVPTLNRPVFTIDATTGLGYVTITAAQKVAETTYTEVVASIPQPSIQRLLNVCERLSAANPSRYVVNGYNLGALGKELDKRGHKVSYFRGNEEVNASAMLYRKIAAKEIVHADDELLRVQIPRTVRRNKGDNFVISRKDSSVEIDAVMSTAIGVLYAETETEEEIQLFV